MYLIPLIHIIASIYIFIATIISIPCDCLCALPPPKKYLDEFLDLMNSSLNKILDEDDFQNILPDEIYHINNDLAHSKKESSSFNKNSKADDLNEILKRDAPANSALESGDRASKNLSEKKSKRILSTVKQEDQRDIPAGYRNLKFYPSVVCERFEVARRHCVLVRQLGSTLTLGVNVDGSERAGSNIRWYRYLKKQQSDHYIRENLRRDFLPWNLNLGGTRHELRISPVTETDRAFNYFVAELLSPTQPGYRQNSFARKSIIRFTIEPVHIDMGPLYHGEEIILYARSYMEVPQRSVQFFWSLFDSSAMVDHGLPSNMHLNSDRSSVIIKELKTYKNQILTCTVYSNKNVFLARRDFLFRGSVNEETSQQPPLSRQKRNIYARDQQDPENIEEYDDATKDNSYHANPFYSVQQEKANGWDRPLSETIAHQSPADQYNRRDLRSHEMNPEPPVQDGTKFQDPLRFDDVESQIMASCATHHDCNVHATCTRASSSGQKFCKCSHGYNGNGMFCMIETR